MATHARTVTDLAGIRAELAAGGLTATTINFIAYFNDCTHHDWVHDATAKISEKHPSRTIVLDATSEECGISAARANADAPAQSTVQGQRVVVGCNDMPPDELRETVASLLMPDVPTVLWWTDGGLAHPTFSALVDLADALVVNASGNTPDAKMVSELAEFMESRPAVSVRDIAWMRLRPWQDVVAQSFDDPKLREELFAIRRVRIAAGSDAEALYLGGWLGSRLGWVACGRHEFCDRAGVRIPLEFVRAGQARRIVSIEVWTETSHYTATVSTDDPDVLMLKSSGASKRPERVVALAAIDNATLLERAILEPATDEIFQTALRMVGMLLR
ncbi:MAG: hypothetical protein NVSMB64_06390 [Candidatus Velthaea sp.]